MQAIGRCIVDNTSGFLTHRPLGIEIHIGKLERTVNRLIKPTNFADLLDERVKKDYQSKLEDFEKEIRANPNPTGGLLAVGIDQVERGEGQHTAGVSGRKTTGSERT